jgi:hypothetical protein
MRDTVNLHTTPSITDALAWSQDGVIAIAADDHVEILVRHEGTSLGNNC